MIFGVWLYFTHIFRTNSAIEDFREIEKLLKDESFLAYLKISESEIYGDKYDDEVSHKKGAVGPHGFHDGDGFFFFLQKGRHGALDAKAGQQQREDAD